jgi:hypothetical protein
MLAEVLRILSLCSLKREAGLGRKAAVKFAGSFG